MKYTKWRLNEFNAKGLCTHLAGAGVARGRTLTEQLPGNGRWSHSDAA
jgi:hypothetical protein